MAGDSMCVVSVTDSAQADESVVAIARAALRADLPAEDIGDHLGMSSEPDGLVILYFACTRKSYAGWRWSVTMSLATDVEPSVNDIVLLPAEDAIVAPAWVPYRERIKPGDLSPGDLLPVADDDARLVPTYLIGEDEDLDPQARAQVKSVAADLGLGRVRTLGQDGLNGTATRWYAGLAGPDAPIAASAPHHCHSCGFMVRLAGSLSEDFGVCANGDANDDGRAVAMNHGCGAHSEVRLAKRYEPIPLPEHIWDTVTVDELELF
jgi:hypothetical protein